MPSTALSSTSTQKLQSFKACVNLIRKGKVLSADAPSKIINYHIQHLCFVHRQCRTTVGRAHARKHLVSFRHAVQSCLKKSESDCHVGKFTTVFQNTKKQICGLYRKCISLNHVTGMPRTCTIQKQMTVISKVLKSKQCIVSCKRIKQLLLSLQGSENCSLEKISVLNTHLKKLKEVMFAKFRTQTNVNCNNPVTCIVQPQQYLYEDSSMQTKGDDTFNQKSTGYPWYVSDQISNMTTNTCQAIEDSTGQAVFHIHFKFSGKFYRAAFHTKNVKDIKKTVSGLLNINPENLMLNIPESLILLSKGKQVFEVLIKAKGGGKRGPQPYQGSLTHPEKLQCGPCAKCGKDNEDRWYHKSNKSDDFRKFLIDNFKI